MDALERARLSASSSRTSEYMVAPAFWPPESYKRCFSSRSEGMATMRVLHVCLPMEPQTSLYIGTVDDTNLADLIYPNPRSYDSIVSNPKYAGFPSSPKGSSSSFRTCPHGRLGIP